MVNSVPRSRFRKAKYINKEVINNQRQQPITGLLTPMQLSKQKLFIKKRLSKIRYILISLVILIIIGSLYILLILNRNSSPIPLAITRSVSFPIYYPEPSKLPIGFSLDISSFSSRNHVVVYKVTFGKDNELAFSLQAEPAPSAISYFYSRYMPIHTNILTSIGTASIGAINTGQISTLASIPTTGNTWILVNTTSKISQTQLEQVIAAIVKG